MRVLALRVVCALGALAMSSNLGAQSNDGANADALRAQAAARQSIAESIVAREEAASGREFEARFRADVVNSLASLSAEDLQAVVSGGDGLGTSAYGSTQADLVYTPVTPCRIIDTRNAGGVLAAGTTRSFYVAAGNYSSQGGVAASCGIPFGPATAAVINFVAVSPAGAGDFRVTPYGTAIPGASFLNYAAVSGLNIANGLAVATCNPATTTCTRDITIQADVSGAHIVADVQGYFSVAPPAGRAWASVKRGTPPTLEAARTKGFTAVTKPATGVYCLTPPFSLASSQVQVTVEWGSSLGFDLLAFPYTSNYPASPCTGTDLQVRTYDFAAGGAPVLSDDIAFFVWVP